MNAVEVLDQLAALGRRVQAREQRMQQPVFALQFLPLWEQLLVDPVVSLGELLVATRSTPPPLATARRVGGPVFRPLDTSLQEAERGERDSRSPSVPTPLPVQLFTPPPGDGVRLARKQSSLLDILSANIGPPEVSAGARKHAGETVDMREGRQAGRWDEQASRLVARVALPDAGEPRLERDTNVLHAAPVQVTGAPVDQVDRLWLSPSDSLTSELLEAAGRPNQLGNTLADQPAHAFKEAPSLASTLRMGTPVQPKMPPGTGLPTEQTGAAKTSFRPFSLEREDAGPAIPPDVFTPGDQSRERREFVQPASWPPDDRLHGKLAQEDSGWLSAADEEAERPLSMAQVEQVLAALDERLDLMLMRMYGTSANR